MRIAEHPFPPEEVMAYLDGELERDRAVTVQAHLAQCAICQGVASELRQVSQDLASWQPAEPSSNLAVPRAILPETPRRRFVWRISRGWALGFAGGAAVLLLAVSVWFAGMASPRMASHQRTADYASSHVSTPAVGGDSRALSASPRVAGQRRAEGTLPSTAAQTSRGPMIVRTANLEIVTTDFEQIRAAIDRIVNEIGGFVANIQVSDAASARSLHAMLRVPAPRLNDAIGQLRGLGRVVDERQSSDDVAEQVVDLEARLANSRNTERRLNEVLKTRTGNVRDVLEVEREIARVREEIERLDAERSNLERRVAYATVTLQVTEQRQATLDIGPLSVRSRLRNALVDGVRQAYESAVEALLLALSVTPVLVLWIAVLWWPVRASFRWLARAAAGNGAWRRESKAGGVE